MAANFHHPFEPYDIQLQFMSALYQCLEEGKVGIFESPTGTGKSLSLICGSLTWLRDYKRKQFDMSGSHGDGDMEESDWMAEHARRVKQRQALQSREDLEARLRRIREREDRLKKKTQAVDPTIKRQKVSQKPSEATGETEFILDDYESDSDNTARANKVDPIANNFSAETQALMAKLGMSFTTDKTEDDVDDIDELKIFYCSRTHSQLSQFAKELRRVRMPAVIQAEPDDQLGKTNETAALAEEAVKQVTLGSRKALCINPKVSRLGSAAAINERCLELQETKTSKDHRCRYLPNKDTQTSVNEFRDHALAQVRDIEDLGAIGKELGVCPYYASRAVVKPSEIVTLPYPLLLQKSARQALGLSLQDHVIIIDEAHNLMDAIAGLYSVSVTLSQLKKAHAQLMVYLQKFRNRLKGKNRVYVAQTVRLLESITSCLSHVADSRKAHDCVIDGSDLTAGKGVDQINLFKLSQYLQESKLARKVDGYSLHLAEQARPIDKLEPHVRETPALTHVQAFLLTLMNPLAEGRFVATTSNDGPEVELRYMLLDASNHFKDIVEEARAVVLAGGTMSPMNDYTQHLFPYLDPSRIMTLSCGHIVPTTSLLACPVVSGASSRDFNFTFETRMLQTTVLDLGDAILSFVSAIPDGVVVFFPSYAYLEHCVKIWRKGRSAGAQTLWHEINAIKPVFMESQAKMDAQDVPPKPPNTADSVLTAYSAAVAGGAGRGAVLFAVIGATLSEGINFSDSLGRGVAVVGLPFPNPHSAEWKAKMDFISAKQGKDAARDFYTNACMRAVNQAVGRAIRHKGDYAVILLLDRRYGTKSIQDKLPGWIKGSLRHGMGSEQAAHAVGQFYKAKTLP